MDVDMPEETPVFRQMPTEERAAIEAQDGRASIDWSSASTPPPDLQTATYEPYPSFLTAPPPSPKLTPNVNTRIVNLENNRYGFLIKF